MFTGQRSAGGLGCERRLLPSNCADCNLGRGRYPGRLRVFQEEAQAQDEAVRATESKRVNDTALLSSPPSGSSLGSLSPEENQSKVGRKRLLALARQSGLGGGCQFRIMGMIQGEDAVVGHLGGDVAEEVRHGRE